MLDCLSWAFFVLFLKIRLIRAIRGSSISSPQLVFSEFVPIP